MQRYRSAGRLALATLASLAGMAGGGTNLHAQATSPGGQVTPPDAEAPAAAAVATRTAPGAVKLDGRLDEDAWRTTPPIGGFVQRDPNEGRPATEPTEARVLYTDAALYVGVRAFDSEPRRIRGQLTRRDVASPSDWIGVAIDSYHDRRTAFAFMVNPAGVKRDLLLFDDTNEDDSWDAIWDVAVSRDDSGWTAEFRIPLSQLRFGKKDKHVWGFNLYRFVHRLNEEQWWRLPPKNQSGLVSRFGDLAGLEGIEPPRRIELLPYVAASGSAYPGDARNPFRTGSDRFGRAGADVSVGLTSNLTLAATFNPDFGQVEADPAVVNLTAFETFYPEKRPFFTEGLDIFRFPISLGDGDGANEQLFYTRRIGRVPQGRADPRGGYAEEIPYTTILGAAKVSGKLGGWSLGALGSLTAEEQAGVVDSAGRPLRDVVEPRTGYFVGRLARDFRRGRTKLGLFGTAVSRALPENLSYLRSSAYAGGFDWTHRFGNETYALEGWLVGSSVHGAPDAIDRTQRSSARYYQRPDNDYVTYDPTRTSLTGIAGQMAFAKIAGTWRYSTGVDTRSPGFEVNDAGFQRDADRTITWIWVNRRWLEPGRVFRRFDLNFNAWSGWTYGWDRVATGGNVNANFVFPNYWGGWLGVNRELEALSVRALRGGPALLAPGSAGVFGGLYSDSRKGLRFHVNGSHVRQDDGAGWSTRIGTSLAWRPAASLDFRASPALRREFTAWQYLAQADLDGTRHYVFGELRQTVTSMTLRADVTFTPALSLQVYAEPFVAVGDYTGFKEVADPRAGRFADRFLEYGDDQLLMTDGRVTVDVNRDGAGDIALGNPDFTVLSLRSNVVLRWEYLLGSTLYLVWQHGRAETSSDATFRLGTHLQDLFRAPATNTVMVKAVYWLGL